MTWPQQLLHKLINMRRAGSDRWLIGDVTMHRIDGIYTEGGGGGGGMLNPGEMHLSSLGCCRGTQIHIVIHHKLFSPDHTI